MGKTYWYPYEEVFLISDRMFHKQWDVPNLATTSAASHASSSESVWCNGLYWKNQQKPSLQ